jgi:hypothetical protein
LTTRVPWPRILAEGLVIVVSILLALGAEAWWSSRQARVDTYQGLERVLDELAEARENTAGMRTLHARLGRSTAALRERLLSVSVDETVLVPDTLLEGLLWTVGTTQIPTAVIQSFTSGPHLDQIDNEDLRAQLLAWPPLVEDHVDDELRIRQIHDDELGSYLRATADLIQANETVAEFVPATRFGRPTAHLTHETTLESTLRLRNLVDQFVEWFELLARQSETLVVTADSLAESIRQELE